MILKDYQTNTLGIIKAYDAFDTKTPEQAYKAITESSLDMMTRQEMKRILRQRKAAQKAAR